MSLKNKNKIIGFIIILSYFVIGILTLNNYGYTWDYPQEYSYAEANLNYILTKNNTVFNHISGYLYSPSNVGNLIGIITEKIFYEWTNIISKDSAFHLSGVILGTLTLMLIFLFLKKEIGLKTAIIGSLSFALFPRVFGHIHNNPKDIAVMFAYILVMFSVYYFWKQREQKWLYLSAFSLGFAFNTKVLTFFLVPIIIIWILLDKSINKKDLKFKKIKIQHLIKALVIFFIVLYIFNPAYWTHPSNIVKTFFMLNQMPESPYTALGDYPVLLFGERFTQTNSPIYYIPLMFGLVTPISILILFFIGLFKIIKEIKKTFHLLIVAWLIIPILIYMIPGISIYNVIRHILFLVPPICIISGIGGSSIIQVIKERIKIKREYKTYAITTIFILIFLVPLWSIISYHPYQTTYYNELIGGINGAEARFEIEYWGNSYKEGTDWLNKNAEPNSTIIVPEIPDIAKLYLRKDLFVKKQVSTEQNYYLMFMRDHLGYNDLMRTFEKNKNPVYSIEVKGIPILHIYKEFEE